MRQIIILLGILFAVSTADAGDGWYLPILVENRRSFESIRLTKIGAFGLMRKARPGIPAHLHTGMDIKRPRENYHNEPVFPVAKGEVISIRDDGAFAQVIIAHEIERKKVWSVYEHIAGIRVRVGEWAHPFQPVGRFMNQEELNRYGRHFNHVHLEIMKSAPIKLNPDTKKPARFFGTYCLVCYTPSDLAKHYFNPKQFLESQWTDSGEE